MEGLELAVERSSDQDPGIKLQALEHLRKEIRTATSSMTSVPKPLKFLRAHWPTLVSNYQKKDNMYVPGTEHQKLLADIVCFTALDARCPRHHSLRDVEHGGGHAKVGDVICAPHVYCSVRATPTAARDGGVDLALDAGTRT